MRIVDGAAGAIEVEVATPSKAQDTGRLLLLCHGLPLHRGGGGNASKLLPELAARMAADSGWSVAVCSLRGVGGAPGTFSASGWLEDLIAVIDSVGADHQKISLAGFGFGGALALRAAVEVESIRAVAALATPADLGAWCGSPEAFAVACERAGAVGSEPLLEPMALRADVLAIDPLGAAAAVPPRRMMIVHGADDLVVPADEARQLVDAAQGRAELRIIEGAGHWLRADPRMVATLLGWLDRQR